MDGKTMMTFEQFLELQKSMKEAEKDDTPYLAVTNDDELHVIGDPNKTEVKTADYTVYFLFPDTKQYRDRSQAAGDVETDEIDGVPLQAELPKGYFLVRREYKNILISPRNVGKVIEAFAVVERFYYNVTDDGGIKDLSYDELYSVFNAMNNEVGDATYDVVSAVLRMPAAESEYMLPINVCDNAIKMVINQPDLVNCADLFFGLSPKEK